MWADVQETPQRDSGFRQMSFIIVPGSATSHVKCGEHVVAHHPATINQQL
jgi:hypothetical protein